MKFLRANLTLKYFLILVLAALPIVAGLYYYFQIQEVSQEQQIIIYSTAGGTLLVAFLLFLIFTIRPLRRVVSQVKKLLAGKKYKRVRPLSPDEIGVFTHFFNEITLNLEKISGDLLEQRRIFSELDVAKQLQKDVLPKEAKGIEGLEVVAKTKPAAEMGGDSFDFIQREENTMIYIGDVTGHGMPAGLVMMMVNTLVHAFASSDLKVNEALALVNDILWQKITAQRFMTLVMVRWDSMRRKMYYTGAGHEHLLVYRAETKEVESIRSGGIALRMVPDVRNIIKEQEMVFNPNDVILLYSDGITEGRNGEGEMFEVKRLTESLKRHGFRSTSEDIFNRISKDFTEFVGEDFVQEDDITMIVIKQLPEGQEEAKSVKMIINTQGQEEFGNSKKWSWD
jgi:serine phosphatase RsbU (regulator of sigma subunit)